MNISRKSVVPLLAVTLACAQNASAQITNGSFEDAGGSFNAWDVRGDSFIETSTIETNPTDGTYQALLATATDGTAGIVPAGLGVDVANIESSLGLVSGSLALVGNGAIGLGSSVGQTISVEAGGKITFDWDFLTNQTFFDPIGGSQAPDLDHNDFSFFSVVPVANPALGSVTKLADTFYGYSPDPNPPGFTTGFTLTGLANPFISETGYQSFVWTSSYTGLVTIGAGVVNASLTSQNGINSGLFVDNFRYTSPVPEPVSLLTLGTLALAAARRSRGRRQS